MVAHVSVLWELWEQVQERKHVMQAMTSGWQMKGRVDFECLVAREGVRGSKCMKRCIKQCASSCVRFTCALYLLSLFLEFLLLPLTLRCGIAALSDLDFW